MDDDHEVLDWGNEEDDSKNQDPSRAADPELRHTTGDVEDAEDSVSLGEEEDEQEYYTYEQEVSSSTALAKESGQPSTAQAANGDVQHPSSSEDLKREDTSTSQVQPSTGGTPRRNSSSTSTRSPQRPHPTRLTHALPPKPIVTNVPFLHPSHPSIVEATAMSVTTRSTVRSESNKGKINPSSATTVSTSGTGMASAAVDSEPLPRHWELREARSGPGGTYYYNIRTQQSTWTRPVSSSNSSLSRSHSRSDNTRRHRGSNLPVGYKNLSPSRSDHPHPRSQELSRHSRRAQPPPDPDLTDPQEAAAASDLNGLSYEDRHYRPGGAENPVPSADNRRGDRSREEHLDSRFNPHPELAFTPPPPSPPRVRERARTLSPVPMTPSSSSHAREPRSSRVPRSGRSGRNANTDADSSIQRDRDVLPPTLAPPPTRSHWSQAPSNPPELNSTVYQESRRRSRNQNEASYEGPAFEGRPPMPPRNGSIRGRNRDRDQPRAAEIREQNRIQNIPSPRTRSPLPHNRDNRTRDSDFPPPRELEQARAIPVRPVSPPASTLSSTQRKRERPTRFGQPSASTSPVLTLSVVSAPRPPAVELQAYPRWPIEEDDPFVPDDIRSPPPQESQPRRDAVGVRDELTTSSASQQIAPGDNDAPPLSRYSSKHSRSMDDHNIGLDRAQFQSSSAQDRLSPSSEQAARRKRVPLPPQAAEFRDLGSRPKDDWERALHTPQDRPSSRVGPNDPDGQLPARPRGQQRSSSNLPPSGPRSQPYSQSRGDGDFQRSHPASSGRYTDRDRERDTRRRDDRRSSAPVYPPPALNELSMDVDTPSLPPRPRRPSPIPMQMRIPEIESTTPGTYPDREDAPPRGPRAMSGSKPNPSANRQHTSTSPVTPFSHAPGAGSRPDLERSPPPHITGRMHHGGRENEFDMPPRREAPPEWREGRGGYPSERGRRETRGRPNDFHRLPPAPAMASGANHVPIGNQRKGMGNGGPPVPPPSGMRMNVGPPPPGMGGTSSRPPRGTGMRGRGGAPPREFYERQPYNDGQDTYRSRRSEANVPPPRQREGSLPPFQKHQTLSVNTAVARESGPYSSSPQQSRFDPTHDSARISARTWTPRGGGSPPRDTVHASVSTASDGRPPTPPLLSTEPSNVSPGWESSDMGRPPAHYPDSRTQGRLGSSRGAHILPETRPTRPGPDEQPPRGGDRHIHDPQPSRSHSLEGRLGDRYDEPFVQPVRQPHALPPNPTLHRDHQKSQSPDMNRRMPERRPMRSDYVSSGWGDSGRAPFSDRSKDFHGQRTHDDELPPDGRMSRSARPRKYSSNYTPQEDPMGMAMDLEDGPRRIHSQEHESQYSQHRPEMSRRGESLLARMQLDQNGDEMQDDMLSQSLRERVQVPSKRDRDDVMGDRYALDDSFDDDEDPASKRIRRKSVKQKKFKRGPP